MKFTPGPWIGIPDYGVVDTKGNSVFRTGCGCCTSGDLSDGDARLIAAAPDIYEALKELTEYATNNEFAHFTQEGLLVIEAAKKALTKTEGEPEN
jgi:hypothetical protein